MNSLEIWMASVDARLKALQITDSPGVKIEHSSQGVTLHFRDRRGGGSSGGTSIAKFRIEVLHDSALKCRKYDGSGNLEVAYTWVAKPYALQAVGAGFGESGWEFESIAENNQQRRIRYTGSSPSIEAIETVTPPYRVGDHIYAGEVATGYNISVVDNGETQTVTPGWIDMNVDARRWELDRKIALVCSAGANRRVIVRAGQPEGT